MRDADHKVQIAHDLTEHSGVFPEPALPDTKPEEAQDSLEFLLPGERLVFPALAPLGQVPRVEIAQQGNTALLKFSIMDLLLSGR